MPPRHSRPWPENSGYDRVDRRAIQTRPDTSRRRNGGVERLGLRALSALIPADSAAVEAYGVIRDAMKNKGVAARSCIVLYQRGREVVIQPYGKGMVMTALRNHNEMVAEDSVFEGLTKAKYDPELLEIAGMLIDKKVTTFDPSKFEDTYEDALIAMIDAKRKGKAPPKAAPKPKENVINLAEVLKKSLKQEGLATPRKSAPKRKSA
jgi:DNA end-binding protein Ku